MTPECVLVTGGAGFAGSALSIALKGVFPESRIVAFDNLRRRGAELNLRRLREAGVEFIHGDVRAPEDLASLPHKPDLIVECSAEASAQAGYGGGPQYVIDTNLIGAYHCLELARRSNARFLFLSTSRVYPFDALNRLDWCESETRFVLKSSQSIPGASSLGVNEDFPLNGPRSLYGMSKLAAELMLEEYADAYGLRYIVNRFGLLAGPWQMAKSDQGVMSLWVAHHFFRRPLSYIGFGGTGKQVRDILHVEDFCALLIDQIKNFELYEGRVWNAGGGAANSLSLLETTELCREVTGITVPITSVETNRPADVRIYFTDAGRVTAVNNWAPLKSPRDTLVDIASWLRREEANLSGII